MHDNDRAVEGERFHNTFAGAMSLNARLTFYISSDLNRYA